jgi:hypothetical protein
VSMMANVGLGAVLLHLVKLAAVLHRSKEIRAQCQLIKPACKR